MNTRRLLLAVLSLALVLSCSLGSDPGGGASGSITLSQDALLLAVDGSVTLTAKVYSSTNNQAVTWKSSDAGVATVSASGLVTGIAKGTATITATSASASATKGCKVTVDSKLAGANTVVQKLPKLTVVAPNSLAARSGSARGLDSRVAEADFSVLTGAVSDRAYNGSGSLASSLDGSSVTMMKSILESLNNELDLIKARIKYGLYSFDKPWEDHTTISSDLAYHTMVNLTDLSESGASTRSYAIAKTMLTMERDDGGAWAPRCTWDLYKITEGADGKLQVEAWNAQSIAMAKVGGQISTSAADGTTYYDFHYIRYDEAADVISMFSNAGSVNFYYWYHPNGYERTIYSQYKSYSDKENDFYSEYCNFMWGDEYDGVAAGFSRYRSLFSDIVSLNTSYNEDYFTKLDGHPGTYLGGKKYGTYANVLEFSAIPSFYYEWPIDLLAVADTTKQLVSVPNETTIYNKKDLLFYFTPLGMTYDTFAADGAGVALLGPNSGSSSTNSIGNVISDTYQDYDTSTHSWSYAKTLYSYRDTSSSSTFNFQPDSNFTIASPLATTAIAMSEKCAGWMVPGNERYHYIEDIDAYHEQYAQIDMSYVEPMSVDLPTAR